MTMEWQKVFFHSLKTELVCEQIYQNRSVARQEIFKYIEIFYNRKRRHSILDYKPLLDIRNVERSLNNVSDLLGED
jgi:transposase InsO family protein